MFCEIKNCNERPTWRITFQVPRYPAPETRRICSTCRDIVVEMVRDAGGTCEVATLSLARRAPRQEHEESVGEGRVGEWRSGKN